MSNVIRYDSLLLAALGRALHARLAGRAVRGIWLDRVDRSLIIRFAATVRKGTDSFLRWHLHPTSGDVVLSEEPLTPVGSTVQVAPGTTLTAVRTLPDERILRFELDARDAAAGFARSIVVELIGSRWNAIALGDSDTVIALLQVRERDGVMLRPGALYTAPSGHARAGAASPLDESAYGDLMRNADAGDDVRRVLIQNVAYTSPLNATYIVAPLVARVDDGTLHESFVRYATLIASNDAYILDDGRGQPYPSALGRIDSTHATDLIDAFGEVAARTAVAPAAPPAGSIDAAIAAVHERIRRIDERIERLASESRDAQEESDLMRRDADLLYAQLNRVERGAATAELDDFEGGVVQVKLDPALTAKENASKWYEQAKRRENAAERVPLMIRKARSERAALEATQARLIEGSGTAEEIARLAAEAVRARPNDETQQLPYRSYRTTSGIEVRAGRNSRANDQLTLHHSSPNDIWLHARDVSGAHVVLRWTDRDANPSARDIEEAACIAAVHSRARTSGLVPVDWTRRKYVRKPRKSPAGSVMVERSKTVFVVPDAGLEKRLRED